MFDCYVINLDRSKARWELVEKGFAGISVHLSRFSAFDAKSEPEQAEKLLNSASFQRNMGRKAVLGEIGCYQSHLNVMRHFLETDAELAVICEDDVIPDRNLAGILEEAAKYASCWDLLRLACCREKGFVPYKKLTERHFLGTNIKGFANTPAYMINRRGAESLLKHLVPMPLPYDLALYSGWEDVKEMSLLPGAFELTLASSDSVLGRVKKFHSPFRFYWWSSVFYKFTARKRRYAIQRMRIRNLKISNQISKRSPEGN